MPRAPRPGAARAASSQQVAARPPAQRGEDLRLLLEQGQHQNDGVRPALEEVGHGIGAGHARQMNVQEQNVVPVARQRSQAPLPPSGRRQCRRIPGVPRSIRRPSLVARSSSTSATRIGRPVFMASPGAVCGKGPLRQAHDHASFATAGLSARGVLVHRGINLAVLGGAAVASTGCRPSFSSRRSAAPRRPGPPPRPASSDAAPDET
jgi:hypothetical protein